MNPDVKARWVAALRSGQYRQGHGWLRQDDDGMSFCCFGVLCDISGLGEWDERRDGEGVYVVGKRRNATFPPVPVALWANVNIHDTIDLASSGSTGVLRLDAHNDAGRTFDEIADAIEAQW